jgi:outer membrane lipoprotein SlyB
VAGGVIGGVAGYELGGGDPLATGVGAAAGAIFGEELGR